MLLGLKFDEYSIGSRVGSEKLPASAHELTCPSSVFIEKDGRFDFNLSGSFAPIIVLFRGQWRTGRWPRLAVVMSTYGVRSRFIRRLDYSVSPAPKAFKLRSRQNIAFCLDLSGVPLTMMSSTYCGHAWWSCFTARILALSEVTSLVKVAPKMFQLTPEKFLRQLSLSVIIAAQLRFSFRNTGSVTEAELSFGCVATSICCEPVMKPEVAVNANWGLILPTARFRGLAIVRPGPSGTSVLALGFVLRKELCADCCYMYVDKCGQ